MDVRGTALDRVHEHLVDELDHRRVVATGGIHARAVTVVVDRADIERVEAFGILAEVGDHIRCRTLCLLDRAVEQVDLDQDRFDDVVGLELDLFQRTHIGRIGDAEEQAVAALEQRQRLVFGDQVLADQVHRQLGEVERLHVEQRHAELGRRRGRDLPARSEAVLDQEGTDRDPLARGLFDRLACFGFGQNPIRNQTPGNAGQASHRRGIHLRRHRNAV